MMSTPFPQNYEQWKHCNYVECGIPLTPSFVSPRLASWRNDSSEETRRFSRLHGDAY